MLIQYCLSTRGFSECDAELVVFLTTDLLSWERVHMKFKLVLNPESLTLILLNKVSVVKLVCEYYGM